MPKSAKTAELAKSPKTQKFLKIPHPKKSDRIQKIFQNGDVTVQLSQLINRVYTKQQ